MKTGDLIRQARKKAGLTQKELGELCGIAEPTIRRYELGKLNPKQETLKKIAKPLGVRWYELYSDDLQKQVEEIDNVISTDTPPGSEQDEFAMLVSHPVVHSLGRRIVDLNQEIRECKAHQTGKEFVSLSESVREYDADFQVVHALLKNRVFPSSYKSLLDLGFSKGEAFSIMEACDSGILPDELPADQLEKEEDIWFELEKRSTDKED